MDHKHGTHPHLRPPESLDYSLVGENSKRAIELGLAEAEWYQTPVPRDTMRELLVRKNGPALRDTIIWFALLGGLAYISWHFWGTWWFIFPYMGYAVLFASSSDSRWHESSHGTAFRSDWMNNTLYEIASFMVMRESTVWRWSHTRHHSDTIIVGRDPEIAVPRPPDIQAFFLNFFNIAVYRHFYLSIIIHSLGKMSKEEKTYIPESEFPKIYLRSRIYISILLAVILLSFTIGSIFPMMMVGFVNFFGTWLMPVYGYTQHAGLAENVLDHRLNCRTVYMNFINRYLYWNMNYHVEHHMFPLVPYHALPRLHQIVKHDYPDPYPSLWAAWKEIVPAVFKQVKDPAYHVKRKLPESNTKIDRKILRSDKQPDDSGWVEVGPLDELKNEDVIRFDHGKKTFVIIKNAEGRLFAMHGICTHGNVHLSDGLVKGDIIECAKHNGRFSLNDGSPARAPICRGLATFPIVEKKGSVFINVQKPEGAGARKEKKWSFRVISNQNVATFITELQVELLHADADTFFEFQPGDYLQFEIPIYEKIDFSEFDILEPYASVWQRQHVLDMTVSNPRGSRRNNYSIAKFDREHQRLTFNIRIATPPPGQECDPGIGSSYMFSLKPGDKIDAIGPFGDFHLRPTQKEIVYIGGGAGMAPLKAHIDKLFFEDLTNRKVSYWYGARSKQEIFYQEHFISIAKDHSNFRFEIALSDPLESDDWLDHTGFIHEVVEEHFIESHSSLNSIEFYLCGPPMMIQACVKMLNKHGISAGQISYDEF